MKRILNIALAVLLSAGSAAIADDADEFLARVVSRSAIPSLASNLMADGAKPAEMLTALEKVMSLSGMTEALNMGGTIWSKEEVDQAVRISKELEADHPDLAQIILESAAKSSDFKEWMKLGNMRAKGHSWPIDDEGAVSAYKRAATANMAFANLTLARRARDGVGMDRDASQALNYFHAALNGSKNEADRALGELISGHASGAFGHLSDLETAASLAETSIDQGSLVAAEAVLSMHPRLDAKSGAIAALRSRAVILATQAAGQGDALAAKRLLGWYHTKSLKDPAFLKLADESAVAYASILDPTQVTRHEIVSLALRGVGKPSFPGLREKYEGLPAKETASLLAELLIADQNAYVAILQAEMAAGGYYEGKINGQLGSRTISALKDLCESLEIQKACAIGPMSVTAAKDIGRALADHAR